MLKIRSLKVGDSVSVKSAGYHFYEDTEIVKVKEIFINFYNITLLCVNAIGLEQRVHLEDIYNKVGE